MILALAGKKKSGKDTIADFLVKDHSFIKLSFATPLKDLLIKVFSVPSEYLYDDTKKDQDLPEKITLDYYHLDKIRQIITDEWGFNIDYEARERIEEFHGKEITTPRQLMQIVGTDIIRSNVRDDIFILLLLEKVKLVTHPVVIADARLQNERDFLKKIGAVLALVKRHGTDTTDSHISENDLGNENDYDVIIENNIEINQLRSEIGLWYSMTHKK